MATDRAYPSARNRSGARKGKRSRALETLESILPYLSRYSYAGLFGVILACSFGFPFSKTLSLLGAGILASQGAGNLLLYMVVGLAALVTSDSVYFCIGYFGGPRVLNWRFFARRHFQESLREAEASYRTQEWWAVFSARFTPFVRSVIFLTAGLSRMAPHRFLAADLLSALLFVPAVALSGFFFSENRRSLVGIIQEGEFLASLLILFALALFFLVTRRRKRARGADRKRFQP